MGPGGWTKYDGHEDKEQEQQRVALTKIGSFRTRYCGGKCGKTRYQCLKDNHINMWKDRKFMRSLQYRYDSWLQESHGTRTNSNWFHSNLFSQ